MKSFASLLCILLFSFLVFGCSQEDEVPLELERFWVHWGMLSCIIDQESTSCNLISRTKTLDNVEWEYFENPIKGLKLSPGTFMYIDVIVTTELEADSSISKKYQLHKVVSKFKDEAFKLSGAWKLDDLPGFDKRDLLMSYSKLMIFDPLERILFFSYECDAGYLILKSVTERDILFSEVSFQYSVCNNYSSDLDKEFLARLFRARKYESDDSYWNLLDESDNILIKMVRGNQWPKQ